MPLAAILAAIPWSKVLKISVVVFAALFAVSSVYAGFRFVRGLEERAVEAEAKRAIAITSLEQARMEIDRLSEAAERATEEREEWIARYRELAAREPEVVENVREIIREVPSSITSEECEEAAVELLGVLQALGGAHGP